MERARFGILAAAAELVAGGGPRDVTMAAVSRRAAVAKATVYNHFRDRDELLLALLAFERDQLLAHCSTAPQAEQLTLAATWLSESAVVAGLRRHDPGTLLRLVGAAANDPIANEAVERWCVSAGDPGDALRWLISFVVAPARSIETASAQPESP